MYTPIVNVPADLWDNIKLFVSDSVNSNSPASLKEMLTQMNDIDTPKLYISEQRHKMIVDMAIERVSEFSSCDVQIDRNARTSEGSDNGCYVSAWVWCDFAGTELDKHMEHAAQTTEEVSDES